jgi:hypothetical protein
LLTEQGLWLPEVVLPVFRFVIGMLQTPETDETLQVELTGVSVDGARQYRLRLRA